MIPSEKKKRNAIGTQTHSIEFELNGRPVDADVEPRTLLAFFLRDHLGVKGIHVGCDTTNCGACTVLMDGKSVKSCTVFAVRANGRKITTVEGLSSQGKLSALQEAFTRNHALQCGYCTPGFLMSSTNLLRTNPHPSEEEIRNGLSGNLCMCTGYLNIIKAVKEVSTGKENFEVRLSGNDDGEGAD